MKEATLVELTPSEMEVLSGGLRDVSIVFAPEKERKLTLVIIRNNGNTNYPPPY